VRSKAAESEQLLDRIYDIAVAPERFEQLVDSWVQRLKRQRDGDDFGIFVDPTLLGHVERAERVLRELIDVVGEERDSARDWANGVKAAAIVVNRRGQVVAANEGGRKGLGIRIGNGLQALPIVADDLSVLGEMIETLDQLAPDESRLLRLRMLGGTSPILVRLVDRVGGNSDHIGVVTSVLHWPERLSGELKGAFQLTDAELTVLKDLALGYSVKEICARSGRSEPTLRTHIASILDKTDTRSQLELVRMTLTLLDAGESVAPLVQLRGPPGVQPDENRYETLILADRRRLDYLVIGDPRGRSFLLLPTDIGFSRFPHAAEQWLADHAIRMIVPVRAGFGYSSPLPKRRNAYDVAILDMQELLDALGVRRCPVAAMCDDFRMGVEMACKIPARVSAIIGIAPTPPASTPQHYQRMSKWTRFIAGNATYAPRALPFLAMAAFQYARRIGPKRFMQSVLAGSAPDLRLLDDDEIFTAILRGSEIAIGPKFAAHAAYAAGVIASHGSDWSETLARCPVPMILYSGHRDPLSPFATVKEYAGITPNITLHEFPEYGFLLYPVWPQIFAEIERRLVD